jgi:hypothetical protein
MFKGIVGFLVIIAVVVLLFQIVPPMMNNYSFEDDLRTVALMDGSNIQKSDDDIRNDVLRKAKDEGLPLGPKQITVQHINTPGISAVYVAADYTVTVTFPGYSFDMHFTPNSGNKSF